MIISPPHDPARDDLGASHAQGGRRAAGAVRRRKQRATGIRGARTRVLDSRGGLGRGRLDPAGDRRMIRGREDQPSERSLWLRRSRLDRQHDGHGTSGVAIVRNWRGALARHRAIHATGFCRVHGSREHGHISGLVLHRKWHRRSQGQRRPQEKGGDQQSPQDARDHASHHGRRDSTACR